MAEPRFAEAEVRYGHPQPAVPGSTLIVWLSLATAPSPAEVTVTTRADCPSAEAVERDIGVLLGDAPAEPLRARIDVRGPTDAVAVTVAYDANGRSWTRELEGGSCPAVLKAAALVVAVGLDPLRVRESVEPVLLRPTRIEPAGVEPIPALPPTSGVAEPRTPEVLNPVPSLPPAADEDVRRRVPLGVSAFVVGGGALGLTPEVAGHLGGGVAVRGRAWRVELLGQHQFARRVRHSQTPSAGADVSRTQARPSACWTPQLGAFMFGLCGGLDVGVVVGRGFGLDDRAVARAPWVGLTPSMRGMWRPKGPVSLGIHLDAPISVQRPIFDIDDFSTPLFQVGAVGLMAGFAVEFTFFDETQRSRR